MSYFATRKVLDGLRDMKWPDALISGVTVDGRENCTVTLDGATVTQLWQKLCDELLAVIPSPERDPASTPPDRGT